MTVRRSVAVTGITLGILLGIALAGVAGLWTVQRDRALPNTFVAGVAVGGLTAVEIESALAPLSTSRESEPITFVFEEDEVVLPPAELAYEVDLEATVAAAMSRGRDHPLRDLVTRVRSYRDRVELDLVHDYDEALASAWVDEVAAEIDRPISPGRVEIDPVTLTVEVELPHGSAELRRDETLELIDDALLSTGHRTLRLPVDTEPQRVPDDDVLTVAAQVEGALAGPLELRSPYASLTLSPRDIAALIDVVERPRGERATLELEVTEQNLRQVVGDEGERFDTDPVEARYVLDRRPPRFFDDQGSTSFTPIEAPATIEPGQSGTRFDPALAAEQLTDLLRRGAREAELRLETIEPKLSTERAQELRPTHLLATFTTYHAAGQARVTNIQRLADEIDGATLLPGEQFSINGISGRRTCEGGYVLAGTIIRGELVDTCGGGTSQFGTTTFNAAFFAGLQLDEWKAHSWYISRYPMGREATINYPELDVKFTNTTDGAVVVKTTHSSSSITVSIYGQPVASRVSAEHGSPFNPRSYDEERRGASDLCEGQTRVIQSGGGGFTVDVVREMEFLNGATEQQQIRTVYLPQRRIVEEGTRNCNGGDDRPPEEEDGDQAIDDVGS